MRYRRQLFHTKDPYDLPGTDRLFLQAVRENCAFQYANCPEYRTILDHFGFLPQDLRCYEDLGRLPFLPTLLFKKRRMFSMPPHRLWVKATSSGTGGQFSRVGFEPSGLLCGLHMVLRVGRMRRLFSPTPANYVLFGYKPHRGNQTAVTKTALGATFFTPALHRSYALRFQDGAYSPDLEGTVDALQAYSRSRFPTRLMGFPSYTYFVLKMMEDRGIRLRLQPGSLVMLGGGWKQFYTEQVEKEVLYDLAHRVLGVEEDHIVEFFGAVEHPILYCDCPNHHFHVPVYSRVIIRDVDTLEPLPLGRPGLVNLITPMVRGTPLLSVMTDDLGVLHEGGTCGCGIRSPYLEILGRMGLRDIKTCAAGAAELLSGVKL